MPAGSRCHVVGRACFTPAVAELACSAGETGAHVGIAEGKDRSVFIDAFRDDKLEVSVPVLRDAEVGNRSEMRIELGQITAARLAVEHRHDLHSGFLRGNVGIPASAVADDADILVEIDGVHLAQLAHAGDRLQDAHCHGDLDIAFHRTGYALLDQHGKCRDQHAVKHACLALGKAVIMGCHESDLLILNPLFKSDHVFCHFPDSLNRAAAFDLKCIQNVLSFGAYRFFIGDVVGNRPHFLPVKLLGVKMHPVVKVGLVDIQIHHAGVRAADLGQVCIPEAAADLSCTAPVLNFSLSNRIASLDDAGNHGMALSRALQISYHLTDGAAGIEFAEPGCRIRVGVVRSFLLLQVHEHHRYVQIAHSREHVVGSRIGKQLQDHEIHIGRTEFVTGCHSQFLGCHKTSVDQFHAVRDHTLEISILALEFRNKRRELRQISAERNRKNTNPCFCIY